MKKSILILLLLLTPCFGKSPIIHQVSSLNVQTVDVKSIRPYQKPDLTPVEDIIREYRESYTLLFILVNTAFVLAVLLV